MCINVSEAPEFVEDVEVVDGPARLNDAENELFDWIVGGQAQAALVRSQFEGEDVAVIASFEINDYDDQVVNLTPVAILLQTSDKARELFERLTPPDQAVADGGGFAERSVPEVDPFGEFMAQLERAIYGEAEDADVIDVTA